MVTHNHYFKYYIQLTYSIHTFLNLKRFFMRRLFLNKTLISRIANENHSGFSPGFSPTNG